MAKDVLTAKKNTNEGVKYTPLPSFDELVAMANDNPEQLEALRQAMINEVIDQAQPATKARLRGLQFQIDAQRSIAKTSLAACVKLSSMMMDSFEKMRAELPATKRIGRFGLSVQSAHIDTTQNDYAQASNVIQFRR